VCSLFILTYRPDGRRPVFVRYFCYIYIELVLHLYGTCAEFVQGLCRACTVSMQNTCSVRAEPTPGYKCKQSQSNSRACSCFAMWFRYVFLPVAGNRNNDDGSLNNVGSNGNYWSSSVDGTNARNLNFNSSNANVNSNNRANGNSVRCRKDGPFWHLIRLLYELERNDGYVSMKFYAILN
jgi:hypothetical protein